MFRLRWLAGPMFAISVTAEAQPTLRPAMPQRPSAFRFDTRVAPFLPASYDQAARRYDPVVRGRGRWRMTVDNCRYLPERMFSIPLERMRPDGSVTTEIAERPFPAYPDSLTAYTWTVRDSLSNRLVDEQRIPITDARVDFEGQEACRPPQLFVDGTGTYVVTLMAESRRGSPVTRTEYVRVRRHLLVASIGDSYASGEGNPDRPGVPEPSWMDCEQAVLTKVLELSIPMEKPAFWVEPNAHRSMLSGPARGAQQSMLSHAAAGDVMTFISVASSGAEVDAGLLNPQAPWQAPHGGQIAELAAVVDSQSLDGLLISIGGNDVGFSNTLTRLTKFRDRYATIPDTARVVLRFTPNPRLDIQLMFGSRAADVERETAQALDTLRDDFRRVAAALGTHGIVAKRIFLTGYPTALFDMSDGSVGEGCGLFDNGHFLGKITVSDAVLISTLARWLNETLREVAEEHGWIFVPVEEGFRGHGYCSGGSYFTFASESCRTQGDLDGTMHPNYTGTGVYAGRIAETLSSVLWPMRLPTPTRARISSTPR